jgi:AhpD family alkylhydroperoxidase
MDITINFEKVQPKALQAMAALEKYINATSLTDIQKELIKIRASQINGCAYCIDLHTKIALGKGEAAQRLFMLSAWKDSSLFTEEERALLLLTEEITKIVDGVSDTTYQLAHRHFSKETIAEIIMIVTVINAWNRISISSRLKA